jgi:hypothetical protein
MVLMVSRLWKKRSLAGLLLCLLSFSLNGCIYLVVGSMGALGGYVASPDTVEGMIGGISQDEVWNHAIDVISVMGIIEEKNDAGGIIIANIQGTRVVVTMTDLGTNSVKVSVKARKAFLPRIRVAQDVYMKIEQGLYKEPSN